MKVLVGKTFGIGNAVLSIPMIKALSSLGHVDVLIGTLPDDFGAKEVMLEAKAFGAISGDVYQDVACDDYDVAVMAIPFDGRWQNGKYGFKAKRVIDGRKRPGNIERLGFDMWEKHEVLYQMENAYELGYSGPVPDSGFLSARVQDPDLVYVGIGHKRDPGGFGASKHFGNQNFIDLMKEVRRIRPQTRFVSTAGLRDQFEVGLKLMQGMGGHPAYVSYTDPLKRSFERLAGCRAYFGNDTGMMHVAASLGIPTYWHTPYSDLVTKNSPWGCPSRVMVSGAERLTLPIEELAEDFVEFVWG